ncbi:serine hydrolase domain-containing protein [Lacticaseibacillus suibinensis]|uniref:serine hydrolase domain-containing protein n=1 Tax=Lacticaseibacillus suibinensis TaxID=2486011 RepID=UPI0019421C86|nr:serine hydrolase domain-containing protein [Lacticaseibacillus suibinensis]
MRYAQNNRSRVHRRLALLGIVAALSLGLGFSLGRWTAPKPPAQTKTVVVKAKAQPAQKAGNSLPRAINNTMQEALERPLAQQHFSGTALMVKHNRIVAEYSAGYANAARKRLNTADTMFQIDSLQKSLTAGLVMQQMVLGKLALTTPVGQFYARLQGQPTLTVAHLLHMNSGLSTPHTLVPKYQSDAQLVAYDAAHLTVRPKTLGQYAYMPVNYVLLAGILEQVTQQDYQQLFMGLYRDRLALKHTAMAYDLSATQPVATGYSLKGSNLYAEPQFVSKDTMHAELGTGQVYMSATDLFRAEQALVSGKLLGVTPAALYPAGQHYGGGFYLNEPQALHANGSGYGFLSTVQISRDGQSGVVILGNVQGQNRARFLNTATQLWQQYLL